MLQQLTEWFDPQLLLTLAKQCGFVRRKARKLTPLLFVQATILLVTQSAVSFRRWAALVGVLGDLCLSKQALWERISVRAVAFLQAVVSLVLARRLPLPAAACSAALKSLGRVLVQDSTTIPLAPRLAAAFPGSRNQRGSHHGHLKIQALYDLLAQRFVSFSLSGFNRNDQAAAHDVVRVVTEVPQGSAPQLEAMIYARLIFVTILAPLCAASPWREGKTPAPPPLSLLKLTGLVSDFFLILCLEASPRRISDTGLLQLNYHGRYEHRSRKHFMETFMNLS